MLVLTENQIAELLTMEECLQAMEEAFREWGRGQAVQRPRSDCSIPSAAPGVLFRFKTMEGGIPKLGTYALRVNIHMTSFPTVEGERQQVHWLAVGESMTGFIILFSTDNGEPLALFPDGWFQAMRVGATSGVGAKFLARKDSSVVALLGSGLQGRAMLPALCAVRQITTVRVYSPTKTHRTAFCEEMRDKLSANIIPVDSAEAAVRGADIVACCTNSRDPVVRAQWLEPGMHVTSILPMDLEPEVFRRSSVIITNSRPWGKWKDEEDYIYLHDYVMGEKEIPRLFQGFRGIIDWEATPGLGDLLVGKTVGRSSDDQITLHANTIGLGIQFAAAGAVVYQRARKRGLGHELPTSWFLRGVHGVTTKILNG